LDDIDRITRDNYVPSPGKSCTDLRWADTKADIADILRARVTTIGPEEHYINVEAGVYLFALNELSEAKLSSSKRRFERMGYI